MFNDPLLHKLELLYKASSAPKRWLRKKNYAKFHSTIQSGLKITKKQQIEEATHLILFAMNFPQFPDGALTAGDKPDFTLNTGNKTVGIEHCCLFIERPGKPSMKGQEQIHEQIIKKAHEHYQDLKRPPLTLSCSFSKDTNYKKSDIDALAREFAGIIPNSLSNETESSCLDEHDQRSNWLMGVQLIQGRAPKIYEPSEGRWTASHGGSVYSSEPYIQTALDEKERKLTRYKKCDEQWALLIVEGFAASSFMTEPNRNHVFNSSFDRVFVYRLMRDTVTEIRCNKVSLCSTKTIEFG